MKVELIKGRLIKTTENEADRRVLNNESDPVKGAALILGDNFTREFGTDKSPYFQTTGTVDQTYIDPFFREVREFTGQPLWTPKLPINLLAHWPITKGSYDGLGMSDLVSAVLDEQGIQLTGYTDAGEWNKMTASEHAQHLFSKWCPRNFGDTWSPGEYYQHGSIITRNRYYVTGHHVALPFGVYPGKQHIYHSTAYAWGGKLSDHWFTKMLSNNWIDSCATPAQRIVIDAYKQLQGGGKYSRNFWDEYQGYHCKPTDELRALGIGSPCCWSNWETKDALWVTSDEFQQLGAQL
jgi:hypothetical protein